MKKFIVGCLVVGLAGVSRGDLRYWNGTGDLSRPWTDAANWRDSTLPVPGDSVVVRGAGKPLIVEDGDAVIASQVNYIWSSTVSNTVCDDVVWNVSTAVPSATQSVTMSSGMFRPMWRSGA